jgi:cell division protein ZapA
MVANSVAVHIAGREYRIRSDADPEWLQRVAEYVDESLRRIRERTRTVDSLDVAILAALNLARELMELKEDGAPITAEIGIERDQLAELIDFVEAELKPVDPTPALNA